MSLHWDARLFVMSKNIRRWNHARADVENDLCVSGDRSQLHQVLMNLLINSRDAMPAGGTITLSVKSFQSSIFPFWSQLPILAKGWMLKPKPEFSSHSLQQKELWRHRIRPRKCSLYHQESWRRNQTHERGWSGTQFDILSTRNEKCPL